MSKKLSQVGEFGLIELIRKQAHQSPRVGVGIGDDAAVVSLSPRKKCLFTTDMLVEDVHFTTKMPPQTIGYKAIACNISDIAAMGGIPKFAVISLGVPGDFNLKFIRELYQGLLNISKKFGVTIVGGDTVKSDKIIINVALLGEGYNYEIVTRATAKEGDQIFVTGPLGNSFKSGWHLKFTPRVRESQYLVKNFKPTSMIDASDGLAADLGHILKSSKVGAVLYEDKIPLRKGAHLQNALYDGEDFELIFTLPRHQADRLKKKKSKFFWIGEITGDAGKCILSDPWGKKTELAKKGYTHF